MARKICSQKRSLPGILLLAAAVVFSVTTSRFATSQETSVDRERITADKYLQVLVRRPRPGVALDRVYGFHVQNDSLEELEAQLLGEPEADDAGSRQMVWGLIQLQRGRSAEAARILGDAEGKLPEDAACSFYLGRALLAVGQTEKAAEAMERAVQRGPSRTEALPMFTELGRIYSRAGESEKSLAVWTRLESLFPGDLRVGGQIARTLADEGNYAEARKRYEKLSNESRKPDEKLAFAVQAAEMRRSLGEADEALQVFEMILARLRPGSWLYTDVRNRIEAGFLKSGDYDGLADYYRKQLDEREDDLTLQTRLARILITAGRLNESKTLLEDCVSRAPDDIDARLTLIDVLVNQNEVAAASTQFEELSKRDTENPDHLIRWGQVLLNDSETPLEQRRDAAAAIWSRLSEARQDDAVTLSQIADLMRGIDRTDQAIALYRQAIDMDPKSPQYREYLGEYLHSLKRTDEAIAIWKTMAEGDLRDRDSLVRLAEVFGTFDQDALALDAWKQASELDLTFAQELRYSQKLRDAKQYKESLARLDVAAKIAETPDEQEQLLSSRIGVYQASGTLREQIEATAKLPETVANLRQLALMQGAAGDLNDAEVSIQKALEAEPENTDVLLVAADIAERQNRFGDAAELFKNLADADSRYRTNYLQRVANLRIRLGQVDQAITTCEAIIDANPASPESYLFLARTAFGVNRDERAIAAIRRAMSVAPRDNTSRRMLASHFADRFRTDEAIELYWQIFDYETKTDDKIDVITSLAPLYDRKADLETLLGRIEEVNRKEGDPRTTQRMVAATHEAVEDYGAAREAIDELLAQQPRDIALLDTMVRLSDAADEVELAAEYQKRITELSNTPENRFKLIQYQLDAGTIDIATALAQRISFLSDPSRLGAMIRSAVSRNDLPTARAICEEALKADDSLWDVKLAYAQLLLSDRNDEDFEKNRVRAVEIAREVREAGAAIDAPPPTRSTRKKGSSHSTSGLPSNYYSNPMYWGQSAYQLAAAMRVGRYASSQYSYYRQSAITQPSTFGHARVMAASMILMNEAIGSTGDAMMKAVAEKLETEFALPGEIDQITNALDLWEYQALTVVQSMLTPNGSMNPYMPTAASGSTKEAEEQRKKQMQIMWRLAELDPSNGVQPIMSSLAQRMMSKQMPSSQMPNMDPLTKDQLDKLAKLNEQVQQNGFPQNMMMGMPAGLGKMMMQAVFAHELKLSGQEELAAQYGPKELAEDAGYFETMGAIQFYLQLDESEKAAELAPQLLTAARKETGARITPGYGQSIGQIVSIGTESAKKFYETNQMPLIDAAIARWALQKAQPSGRSTTLGTGYIDTYTQVGGTYRSIRLRGPLSPRLLDSELVGQIVPLIKLDLKGAGNQVTTIELPKRILDHLQTPFDGAGAAESKSRHVLAAYGHWWAKRPQRCYDALVELCGQYPSDIDLQIERARLASELKQPRLALEALDSFSPLDSKMLVRKEMAAMNLAAEIGDIERAKVAAQRLFGMRLDVNTQLALADQLKRLGLNDRAEAMLQRTRTGRARDENTEIRIAQAFMAADDKETAAEVAYSLLRRLASGRSRQQNNVTYYRQQAVQILQSAGRLDALIERAKRRVESSPKATRPKMELAELYVAAGRTDDANKLWESLSENVPVSATQMIARAEALGKAKKFEQAIDLYLDAFEKEPQRFSNDFYKLTNLVRQGGESFADQLFERMMDFPVEMIPSYRLDELARLGSRDKMTLAKKKFIGRLLSSPSAVTEAYNIARSLSEEQKKEIPEYRTALVDAACNDDAFSVNGTLWQIRSYGGDGRVYGPLEDILTLLADDEAAQKRFREAAANRFEKESLAPAAKFMVALLDLKVDRDREASTQTIASLVDQDADDSATSLTISYGLLWQGGQWLEKDTDFPAAVLVDIYKAARPGNQNVGNSPQYTVDSRLINALFKNGQQGEARDILLKMYRDIDFSQQNQYNPGYGDYQELESFQWIAKKLVTIGSPIDALIVYRDGLSDPGRFERAKRWGGSSGSKERFESGEREALDKTTPKAAADYLLAMVSRWESDEDTPVTLMDASVETLGSTDSPSSLALAIEKTIEKPAQKKRTQQFAERLTALAAAQPKAWRWPALQLMTTTHLGGDGIETLVEELFQRLPPESVFKADGDRDQMVLDYKELLQLYPVAVALHGAGEAHQTHAARLAEYLGTVSGAVGEPAMKIVLARLSGDAADSFAPILDAIRDQVEPGTPPTEALVNQCLRISTEAASAGDWKSSLGALKLALGNGPPLRRISTSRDAFAISTAQSRSNNQQDTQMDTLISKVVPVLDAYSQAIGKNLSTQDVIDSEKAEVADEATLRELTGALLSIMLPADRQGLAFSYAKSIASPTSYDNMSSSAVIDVVSVSNALANVAAECGKSADVYAEISKRYETAVEKDDLAVGLVQVAAAEGDPAMLGEALSKLIATFDDRLPEVGAKQNAASVNTITSQMQTDSRRKSVIVNSIMHAVWPIIRADYVSSEEVRESPALPELASHLAEILDRTNGLIMSDGYTSNRHREIARRLRKQIPKMAIITGDPKAIENYIETEMKSQRTYDAGPDGDRYRRRQFEELTRDLLDQSLLTQIDEVIRKAVTQTSPGARDYRARFEPEICVEINQLSPLVRFDMLKKVTFGRDGKQPLVYLCGLMRYEVPPAIVRAQTPNLDPVVQMAESCRDYPIVNSLLMLIDAGIDTDQSNELFRQFSERSKAVGDEADIALALTKLALAEKGYANKQEVLAEIEPTLKAIAGRIELDLPRKNDKTLTFPELETQLVVRAWRAGLPTAKFEQLLRDLKTYAIRSQRNHVVSAVGRVSALIGIGRTAGGKTESPLKHFASVPLPGRHQPDEVMLPPLFAVSNDGWVSGTSGYDQSHLMFKYPLTGSFQFSVLVRDGSWGETDVAYGGVLYQPNGWQQTAKILGMGYRGEVPFPVPSIVRGQPNVEGVSVSPEGVEGICNGKAYVEDIAGSSYPWISVPHHRFRTTQFKDLKLVGNPTIPREVNLIHETMRGWGVMARGSWRPKSIPKMLLPIGPKQNRKQILDFRKDMESKLAKGPLVGGWSVVDGELHYRKPATPNEYDPSGQIQYLRPLMDGESVEFEFRWEEGKINFAPTIGRLALNLSNSGTTPEWIANDDTYGTDLATKGFIAADKVAEPADPISPDVVPKNLNWNTLVLKRTGDVIDVSLNGESIVEVPVQGYERPGILRVARRDLHVRSIRLTGDWPTEVPEDLMARN